MTTVPIDLEALERAVKNPEITDEELRELAAQVLLAQGGPAIPGAPVTRDELHEYIRKTYGINIPRVAVCPGHKAPFDFVADAFFEKVTSLFGMGSRGGGKSFLVALIHHLNSRFKPGCESATFGAVADQAKRVYSSFKGFLNRGLEEGEIETVGDPMQSETNLKNGSKVEVFTATLAKVNGPHPQKAHSDEVEIMRANAWKESRNLASDKVVDGRRIRAQNIATSTRKWKNGRVDKLFTAFRDAVKRGVRPQFWFYVWCFTPETLVRTAAGYRPIEEVEPGDYVLSRGGIFRRVQAKTARHHDGQINRVRTSCGMTVGVTSEHPWMAVVDDRTGQPAEKPRSRRTDGYRADYVPAGELGVGAYAQVEVLDQTISIDAVEPPASSLRWRGIGRPRFGHSHYKLTDGFLWAVGMYVAEGYRTAQGIAFSLHEDEVECRERLKAIFEDLGFGVYVTGTATGRCVDVHVSSLHLRDWWPDWIGSGSASKAIPSELINLPIDRLEVVAQGVLDGDGCEYFDCLGQTSSVLALQMVEIGLRRGGRPTLNLPTPRPQRKQVHVVNAVGSVAVEERERPGQHLSKRGFWEVAGGLFSKIVEHRQEPYCGPVYDLTIDGDPSFVVGNTLVHNCIFEVAEEVPSCRMVRQDEREARLRELGRDPCELCSCNKIESDTWEDGRLRTLDQVCRGRFFRSRGYRSHEEVVETFMQNDRRTWEAQQECSEAESEGLYVECFSRARHGIKRFYVDPANGPIFTGTDFGTTAVHATLWVQLLMRPITVQRWGDGSPRTLPAGTRILFNMYYEPGKSDSENGKAVLEREKSLARRMGRTELPVRRRWGDVQAASGRKDWRRLGLMLMKYDRDFATHIKEVERLFRKNLYVVVVDDCVEFCEEIEGWRKDENGNEVRVDNHAMAANRYLCQGLHEELGREGLDDTEGELEQPEAASGPGAEEFKDDADSDYDGDWRSEFGAPVGVR